MSLNLLTLTVFIGTAIHVAAPIRCLVCEEQFTEQECEAQAAREPCYEQSTLDWFAKMKRLWSSLVEPYWNTGYQCFELQVCNGSHFWRGCIFENLDLCGEVRNVTHCYTCKDDYCNSLEHKATPNHGHSAAKCPATMPHRTLYLILTLGTLTHLATSLSVRCFICREPGSEQNCDAAATNGTCDELMAYDRFKELKRVKPSLVEPRRNTGYQCFELKLAETEPFTKGCIYRNLDICAEFPEAEHCYLCQQNLCNSLKVKNGAWT
ncbi:hypothetical protein quinque_016177 [Culex quinquefasciatus]